MVQIRSFQIEDYSAVMELWRQTPGLQLREADSEPAIARYLARNPGLSFVALREHRIIGTLLSGHDGRRGYIQHVAVAREQRRQGVAQRLIDAALAALKVEGILKVHLMVKRGTIEGGDFWRRRGWSRREDIDLYSIVLADSDNV